MNALSGIRLDLKIGVRMIARHPGISVLACLAMAVSIGICTGAFELVTQIRRPDLGLTDGDRLVAIQILDRQMARPRRPFLDEFAAWRGNLRSVAGRAFRAGDLQSGAPVAVVNQSFVQRVLGERNAIGQRIRYAPERIVVVGADAAPQDAEPWYEIVGVVRDVRFSLDPSVPDNAGVYHPGVPGPASPTALSTPELNTLVVRVSGSPYSYSSPVREAAAVVDPALRLSGVAALDDIRGGLLRAYSSWLRLASLVGGLAALLAVSGVFSVLSYTVSRRTREIGIRVALGAGRRHIVSVVCARLLAQLALGAVAGGVALVIFDSLVPSRLMGVPLLAASALLLFGAGFAACAGPVRRALRVDPVRAIVAEG